MILHSGILALLCGSGIALLMLLYAAGLGVKILRHWDYRSYSEEQLRLERMTYLVSTMVSYAVGFELFSGFLFIFTVDDIHPLLTGAMCATGSLNANPFGWYALYGKIVIFFTGALWLTLNHVDNKAENCPLIKTKYILLLFLVPLVAGQNVLQTSYFLELNPELITSCCGSLFSTAGTGLAAELAALEIRPAMAAFYGVGLLFIVSAFSVLRTRAGLPRYLCTLSAASFFPVSIAAIVSFVSIYIYQLPTHHCPFDLLQKNYGFIGYPLYLSLFTGTLFGLLPGLFQPIKKIASIGPELQKLEAKWVYAAMAATLSFLLLATWPVLFGPFKMASYAPFH